MKIEIEASWADVDALQPVMLAAQVKQPQPETGEKVISLLRLLCERIIRQLPPREAAK